MQKSEKIFKILSNLLENGILTSKDIQKEISTNFKFKKDKIINNMELVSRKEFEVLKKINYYNKLDHKFIVPTKKIVIFKESIVFGFLGLLRFLKKENINKSVTGSNLSSFSGLIVENKIF